MADFTRPEYASYIALCRELRLEFLWEDGGWFYAEDNTLVRVLGHVQQHYISQGHDDWTQADAGDVWIPRLDDWLAMLETKGMEDFRYLRTIPDGNVHLVTSFMSGSGLEGEHHYADGPTHEEAAARLWMAVSGRADPQK